jgi:hypothetical protein
LTEHQLANRDFQIGTLDLELLARRAASKTIHDEVERLVGSIGTLFSEQVASAMVIRHLNDICVTMMREAVGSIDPHKRSISAVACA